MKSKTFLVSFVIICVISTSSFSTIIIDTGIRGPLSNMSTYQYQDWYTHYAQSFTAPDEWLISLEVPVYENTPHENTSAAPISIELWDNDDNILASSSSFVPTNPSQTPQYLSLDSNIELVSGEVYWVVMHAHSVLIGNGWNGNYGGHKNSSPYLGNQYRVFFAPDNSWQDASVLQPMAFRAEFDSVPEPTSLLLFGLGSLALHKRKP